MTQEELDRCFRELKAARDKAKGDLCLAKREAASMSAALRLIADRLEDKNDIGWAEIEGELCFSDKTRLPSETQVLGILRTIRDSEKVIAEYDEFVA